MLFRQKLEAELESKKKEFIEFAQGQKGELDKYKILLEKLAQTPVANVLQLIEQKKAYGAVPSEELDRYKAVCLPFPESWENHEESRKWALEILKNRTTFAADASQLLLDREINFPAGVIQVGWFENDHRDSGIYEKNARAEVLSPQFLLEGNDKAEYKDRLDTKRFELEIEEAHNFLKRKQGWQERGERMPLAFLDGTLMLPKTILREKNLQKVIDLVKASRDLKVPLIGYVDISKTRDLVNLLNIFTDEPEWDIRVFDPQILHNSVQLKSWGDRSIYFYTDREGLEEFRDENNKPLVGFVYLKTSGSSQPARIDVPAWIAEAGYLDEIIDVIRAECVVGLGYPYPIEAADATAVIHGSDRDIFLRALQKFAEGSKIPFRISPKPQSKARRR